jgi:hypothetical protein
MPWLDRVRNSGTERCDQPRHGHQDNERQQINKTNTEWWQIRVPKPA